MIREMAQGDTQGIVNLLDALHARTPYASVMPDWPNIIEMIDKARKHAMGIVLVAEHNSTLTGVLFGAITPLWWQPKIKIGSDIVFYSRRQGDGRLMLAWLKQWAFKHPEVIRLECGVSSGRAVASVTDLYRAAGFRMEGTRFVADNPHYQQRICV